MVTVEELKAWRKARGYSQAQAGAALGVSRASVQLYEQGRADIPDKVAAKISGDDAPPAPSAKPAKSVQGGELARTAGDAPIYPAGKLAAAMRRNPPYATSALEAKAMRHERARHLKVGVSNIRLLPLRPEWATVGQGPGARRVNSAIPDPVADPAPEWAGPLGVLTASGRVYHVETAHRMKPPGHGPSGSGIDGLW